MGWESKDRYDATMIRQPTKKPLPRNWLHKDLCVSNEESSGIPQCDALSGHLPVSFVPRVLKSLLMVGCEAERLDCMSKF